MSGRSFWKFYRKIGKNWVVMQNGPNWGDGIFKVPGSISLISFTLLWQKFIETKGWYLFWPHRSFLSEKTFSDRISDSDVEIL